MQIYLSIIEFISVYLLRFTIINFIFQIIDCLLIPMLTYLIFITVQSTVFFRWPLLIIGFSFTGISISQSSYYFIQHTEKYRNPIQRRILENLQSALL